MQACEIIEKKSRSFIDSVLWCLNVGPPTASQKWVFSDIMVQLKQVRLWNIVLILFNYFKP